LLLCADFPSEAEFVALSEGARDIKLFLLSMAAPNQNITKYSQTENTGPMTEDRVYEHAWKLHGTMTSGSHLNMFGQPQHPNIARQHTVRWTNSLQSKRRQCCDNQQGSGN
jgi:hypothetical protein